VQGSHPLLQLVQHLQDSAKANTMKFAANIFRPMGTISSPHELAESRQHCGRGLHVEGVWTSRCQTSSVKVLQGQAESCNHPPHAGQKQFHQMLCWIATWHNRAGLCGSAHWPDLACAKPS